MMKQPQTPRYECTLTSEALRIGIQLPTVTDFKRICLDVTEDNLVLDDADGQYALNMGLPMKNTAPDATSAKFSRKSKELVVRIPISALEDTPDAVSLKAATKPASEWKEDGNRAWAFGQYSEARVAWTQAVQTLQRENASDAEMLSTLHSNLSACYRKEGGPVIALVLADLGGANVKGWAKAHTRRAEALQDLERWDEAHTAFQLALECDGQDKTRKSMSKQIRFACDQAKLDVYYRPRMTRMPFCRRTSVVHMPGKGKGLLAKEFIPGNKIIFQEVPLAYGVADDPHLKPRAAPRRTERGCGACGQPLSRPTFPCSDCSEVWCSLACAQQNRARHPHLCTGHRFDGETTAAAKARHQMIDQLRDLGGDVWITVTIIAGLLASGQAQADWVEQYGRMCGQGWTRLCQGAKLGGVDRSQIVQACTKCLLQAFAHQATKDETLGRFLLQLDALMGTVGLNMAEGTREPRPPGPSDASVWVQPEAPGAIKLWYLGAVHSTLNHTCLRTPEQIGRDRHGPNAHCTLVPATSPTGDEVLAIQCFAVRDIAEGEEISIPYATEAMAQDLHGCSLRQYLRDRRDFDCHCGRCAS